MSNSTKIAFWKKSAKHNKISHHLDYISLIYRAGTSEKIVKLKDMAYQLQRSLFYIQYINKTNICNGKKRAASINKCIKDFCEQTIPIIIMVMY